MASAKISTIALLVSLAWSAQPVHSETLACASSVVSVTYNEAKHAEMICQAAEQALALFNRCNIPPLSRPVHVSIVDELEQGCLGVYHCDEDEIEVLSPLAIEDSRDPGGAFVHLDVDNQFRSVVVHELTHAATDDMPCPFEECIVAQEYISYAMQVMSLSAETRKGFEEKYDFGKRVSSDELNAAILFMAPNLFAQKAWAHFSQLDKPCDYIGQLIGGTILLDREQF